jgi:hypothetical protein
VDDVLKISGPLGSNAWLYYSLYGLASHRMSLFLQMLVLVFPFLSQAVLIAGGFWWRRSRATVPPAWVSWLFKLWLGSGAFVWSLILLTYWLFVASMEEMSLVDLVLPFGVIWLACAPAFLLWWAYWEITPRKRLGNITRIEIAEMRITPRYILFNDDPEKYTIQRITQWRVAQPTGKRSLSGVHFTYRDETFAFGTQLTSEQAQWLMDTLKTLMNFRCHDVEQIVFGRTHPAGVERVYSTLFNPDVSGLSIPFWRLRQIAIVTTNYDFHLVERFLTYAVNMIGQEYLRTHVTAVLYGDPAELQPNLRENLRRMCSEVTVQPASSNINF